jgi:hypothetical protein
MSRKLGYTFYPKDWQYDADVLELSIEERFVYRELIDRAFLNNNNVNVSAKVWGSLWQTNARRVGNILETLKVKGLIHIDSLGQTLSVPSVEKRLYGKRNGSLGGEAAALKGTPESTPDVTPESTPKSKSKFKEKSKSKLPLTEGAILPEIYEANSDVKAPDIDFNAKPKIQPNGHVKFVDAWNHFQMRLTGMKIAPQYGGKTGSTMKRIKKQLEVACAETGSDAFEMFMLILDNWHIQDEWTRTNAGGDVGVFGQKLNSIILKIKKQNGSDEQFSKTDDELYAELSQILDERENQDQPTE